MSILRAKTNDIVKEVISDAQMARMINTNCGPAEFPANRIEELISSGLNIEQEAEIESL